MLASELGRLRRLSSAALEHDDLGERYEPLWLRDVAAHAAGHGLRYLADAEPGELQDDRQPPGAATHLDALAGGDRVAWEQYADLLAGRAFRQTLLCRADAPLDEAIDPARLARLWFGATESAGIGEAGAAADDEVAAGLETPAEEHPDRADGGTGYAPSRNGSTGPAAVAQLALVRPRTMAFDELRATLGDVEPDTLAAELWRAFRAGELELSAAPMRHVTAAGERPEASPVARWQAANGAELTSLRHEPVRLDDPLGRFLVRLCDGTRDRPALVEALVAGVGSELALTIGGAPVTDGERVRAQLAQGLATNLDLLARMAMLRA